MARRTTRPQLTPDQQADADRIHAAMLHAAEGDLRELAELLASTDDSNTFGATEFAVRDIVLRVGAKAIETALAERKKGGTTGPLAPAPPAATGPSSSGGSSPPS
jgi:hypothetical protein